VICDDLYCARHAELDLAAQIAASNSRPSSVTRTMYAPRAAPAWSPDGTKLAFDRRDPDQSEIWMIETKELEQLSPPKR
jgi:Tol biopolymer transport system component